MPVYISSRTLPLWLHIIVRIRIPPDLAHFEGDLRLVVVIIAFGQKLVHVGNHSQAE